MAEAINQALIEVLQAKVAGAEWVAFSIDSSTAVGNTDYMDMEVRWWCTACWGTF